MTEDEALGLGREGYLGCLGGSAVVCFLGEKRMFVGECGFVVDAGSAFEEVGNVGLKFRVGAVGVGACGGRRSGEEMVGDEVTVGCDPIHARFDIVDLGYRNMECVNGISADMSGCGFLAKQIATAWNTMF